MKASSIWRWVTSVFLFSGLAYCYGAWDRDAACAIEPDQRSISPDGRWTAVSAARGCGAVVVPSELVDVYRNGMSARKWRPFEKELPAGGTSITLRWRDASHLVIEYGDKGEVYDKDSQIAGLTIEYVAVPLAIQDKKLGKKGSEK